MNPWNPSERLETDERVISDNFMHSLSPDIFLRDDSYRKMRNAVKESQMPGYIEKALLRCNQPFMEQVVDEAFASLSLEMLQQLREADAICWMKYGGMLGLLWKAVEKTIQKNVMQELVKFQLEMDQGFRAHYEITKYWKTGQPSFCWEKVSMEPS